MTTARDQLGVMTLAPGLCRQLDAIMKKPSSSRWLVLFCAVRSRHLVIALADFD
jgi:hypothetical protein